MRITLEYKRNGVCPCGSGKKTKKCCLSGVRLFKAPWSMAVPERLTGIANEDCYLSALRDCSAKRSREHIMTKSILMEASEGEIGGMPFLQGKKRTLPPDAIASHVLCTRHNSMFGESLDKAGLSVFRVLRRFNDTRGTISQRLLVSGHDFERWMLQRLCALHASGQMAFAGEKLIGYRLDYDIAGRALIDNVWPEGAGMHVLKQASRNDQYQWEMLPIFDTATKEIRGLRVSMMGFKFVLFLQPLLVQASDFVFRPQHVSFTGLRKAATMIGFSWLHDGHRHPDLILAADW